MRVAIAARRHSLFLIDHILSSSVHHGVFDPDDVDADADDDPDADDADDSDNADDADADDAADSDADDADAGEELHSVFLIGHILPSSPHQNQKPHYHIQVMFFWLFFIYFTCTHAYQQQSFCWWLH